MLRLGLKFVSLFGLLLGIPLAANLAYSQNKDLPSREQGYRRIAFDDFVIDGRAFANSGAKVSIQGFYLKRGEVETLFRSGIITGTTDGIGLLTDDASRDVQKYFLGCRNVSELTPTLGCQVKILGHVATCPKTTLPGSKSGPCFVVEGGWGPSE